MYREQSGLTQEQLAERVHYSNAGMISQIEDGLKSPSLEKAQDLAIQLGVSLSELVGDTPPRHTVTNHASGDHTVIQNIEGHYCAVHREDLTALVKQCMAEGLAAVQTSLVETLHALLAPSPAEGSPRPEPVSFPPTVGAEP